MVEREGMPGDTFPGLASQQLAPAIDDPERTTAPPSRLAVGHRVAARLLTGTRHGRRQRTSALLRGGNDE